MTLLEELIDGDIGKYPIRTATGSMYRLDLSEPPLRDGITPTLRDISEVISIIRLQEPHKA